jgi:hypothetical protein
MVPCPSSAVSCTVLRFSASPRRGGKNGFAALSKAPAASAWPMPTVLPFALKVTNAPAGNPVASTGKALQTGNDPHARDL